MTVRYLILALTICTLTITLFSCNARSKKAFQVTRLDTTIKATKIPILELADNYTKYHGQYIETTGRFRQAFEQFAIYPYKQFLNGKVKGFWLDTDKDLDIDDSSLVKMNGKQVTIKGMVDTTHKGHLGMYLATIRRIYFWQD